MPWDEFSDHVTTQAVGARFMESPEGENIFQLVRDIVGLNDPYTVRQACRRWRTWTSRARPEDRAAAADDERDARRPLPT